MYRGGVGFRCAKVHPAARGQVAFAVKCVAFRLAVGAGGAGARGFGFDAAPRVDLAGFNQAVAGSACADLIHATGCKADDVPQQGVVGVVALANQSGDCVFIAHGIACCGRCIGGGCGIGLYAGGVNLPGDAACACFVHGATPEHIAVHGHAFAHLSAQVVVAVSSIIACAGGGPGGLAFGGVGCSGAHCAVGVVGPVADQVGFAAFGLPAQCVVGNGGQFAFAVLL